ncbi:MAG: UDP-glucose 4-epimerase GalE [Alphaproteobacteria bacterium]
MAKTILLTGGAGYIGSHMAVELLNNNYNVVIVDNFVNSKKEVLDNIKTITNKDFKFYEVDVCDEKLETVFKENKIDAVIHFAALKAVGESTEKPELYYENNIGGLENVLQVMENNNCKNIVFSSSATVYGDPEYLPIDEEHSLSATNPYGETKIACEEILRALYEDDNLYNIAILRYFNPVGAHSSGLIGEDPDGIPNNLAPFVGKVTIGELGMVKVFGNDYDTPDGTGVRDYIHIMDLIDGHIKALEKIDSLTCDGINLGTGKGYSVLEMIKSFEKISGNKVPYEICPRREGDVGTCYASCDIAKEKLGFVAQYDLDDMVSSHLNWIKK